MPLKLDSCLMSTLWPTVHISLKSPQSTRSLYYHISLFIYLKSPQSTRSLVYHISLFIYLKSPQSTRSLVYHSSLFIYLKSPKSYIMRVKQKYNLKYIHNLVLSYPPVFPEIVSINIFSFNIHDLHLYKFT